MGFYLNRLWRDGRFSLSLVAAGPLTSENAFHSGDQRTNSDVREKTIVNPMTREAKNQKKILHGDTALSPPD
jgi:hypothetical protein